MSIYRWIKEKVIKINLFENELSHTDPFHLRTSLISTRVYISLLLISIITLIVYTALDSQSQSMTIRNPSQTVYEDLLKKYPTTLSCRCNQITIPYSTFISIAVKYHPICSSYFVSDTWINRLFNPYISYYIQIDFRSSASGQFQLLSSLCSLAKSTVNDTLNDFLSDSFFSIDTISPNSLETQGQAQSLFVQTSTINAIRGILHLIRETTYSNQLQPALQTVRMNALYIYPNGDLASGILDGSFVNGDGTLCYCSGSATCSSPSGFFNLYGYDTGGMFVSPEPSIANVTGFVTGCYAIESLFQSTLECFFDKECLNTVLTFFPTNNTTDINILMANQTQFLPTTLIETIVNGLFIEQWSLSISFSAYYEQCAPISCTYTFIRRNNLIHILTTLLGLYGGLTVVLRLCVPRIIVWWRNRSIRTTQVNPGKHFYCVKVRKPTVYFFL